jgi:hypothetical protein
LDPTYTSSDGTTFCLAMRIDIAEPAASITVTSLFPNQTFAPGSLYEGAARAEGTFAGKPVCGTAWNEQSLPQGDKPRGLAWR